MHSILLFLYFNRYDSDHAHIPGEFRGHKAHWGLVSGFILQTTAELIEDQMLKRDTKIDNLWHYRPRASEGASLKSTLFNEGWHQNMTALLVLYRQGKSRNLNCSSLHNMARSNGQLRSYPNIDDYIIGSVEKGLCNKTVVLHKKSPGLSDLLCTIKDKDSQPDF